MTDLPEKAISHLAIPALRSGVELIAATKAYARDSSLESWRHVLSTGLLLVLALTGTFWHFPPVVRGLCSVLAGLLILRFFVIYHDQQHHAILGDSKLAEGLMRAFGICVLSSSSIWRSSHNHHHHHNSKLRGSHIGSFPIMTKAQFLRSPRSRRLQYLFTRHPATILFGYIFMFLYGMCLSPFFKDPRKHGDCLLALLLHIGIATGLFLFGGWTAVVLTQTVPHFVACAIGTYLFYAQHNFPGVSFKDKAGWTYEKAALESSSYMKMGPIMAWFTANIGYHHVHHLNARIPFYRLPEAHRGIPELSNPRTTTLSPIDIYRCLRLKIWDVDAQAMVGLKEIRDGSDADSESLPAVTR